MRWADSRNGSPSGRLWYRAVVGLRTGTDFGGSPFSCARWFDLGVFQTDSAENRLLSPSPNTIRRTCPTCGKCFHIHESQRADTVECPHCAVHVRAEPDESSRLRRATPQKQTTAESSSAKRPSDDSSNKPSAESESHPQLAWAIALVLGAVGLQSLVAGPSIVLGIGVIVCGAVCAPPLNRRLLDAIGIKYSRGFLTILAVGVILVGVAVVSDGAPAYAVIDRFEMLNGTVQGDVLIESFSLSTPVETRSNAAVDVARREGFDTVSLYSTLEAQEASMSAAFSRTHPGAYRDGYLGELRDGEFVAAESRRIAAAPRVTIARNEQIGFREVVGLVALGIGAVLWWKLMWPKYAAEKERLAALAKLEHRLAHEPIYCPNCKHEVAATKNLYDAEAAKRGAPPFPAWCHAMYAACTVMGAMSACIFPCLAVFGIASVVAVWVADFRQSRKPYGTYRVCPVCSLRLTEPGHYTAPNADEHRPS